MIEWLAVNWLPLVIVIIAIVIGIIYLLKKKGLRQTAIDAIVWAEREFATEAGQEKMQKAIDYCQQLIPFLHFIPDSIIQSFLQGIFNQIKEALEQQPNEKKTIDEVKEDVVG